MHREEWCAVQFLKCRNKNNLDVFDRQEVEVAQVKFGCTTIDEKLVINLFEVSLAVRNVRKGLRVLWPVRLLNVLFRADTFIEHVHVNCGLLRREVFG